MRMKDKRLVLKALKRNAIEIISRVEDYSGLEFDRIPGIKAAGSLIEDWKAIIADGEDFEELHNLIHELEEIEQYVPQAA